MLPGFFLKGRWFKLAIKSARLGYINYSTWRGTTKERRKESWIFNDVEDEIFCSILEPNESAPEQINKRLPWLSTGTDGEKPNEQALEQYDIEYKKATE